MDIKASGGIRTTRPPAYEASTLPLCAPRSGATDAMFIYKHSI